MFLKHLGLRNFRSYKNLNIDINSNLNFIYGANGTGKTGLLEAISFLSETRSFKKCDDKELINTKEKFASIEGTYEDGDYKHEINALIEEKGKTFILDDVKKKTTAQVIGNLLTVSYEPSQVFLFKDEPNLRRRMMNETLSPIDAQYLYSLGRYNKYLRERNQALSLDYDRDVIRVLTQELIMSSYRIMVMRRRFVKRLDIEVNKNFKKLDKSDKEVHLSYLTNYPFEDNLEDYIEAMKKAFEARRSEEATKKTTLIGIHRDDIKASLDGLDLASSGSQGQNRLVTIAIKISIANLILEVTKKPPILLLDDIFSDLDIDHINSLQDELKNYPGQIFATGCNILGETKDWDLLKIVDQKIERSN